MFHANTADHSSITYQSTDVQSHSATMRKKPLNVHYCIVSYAALTSNFITVESLASSTVLLGSEQRQRCWACQGGLPESELNSSEVDDSLFKNTSVLPTYLIMAFIYSKFLTIPQWIIWEVALARKSLFSFASQLE